jgi:hypothetical protein
MSDPITLASGKIGSDLIVSPHAQGSVVITWPKNSISVSERRFPDVAATLTRLIASAAMELARIKAGDRR